MVWMGSERPIAGAATVVAEGLFAMTPVATPEGWVPAGELGPGDAVLTFDNGVQTVSTVYSAPFQDAPAELWPLRVPAWALDNRDEIVLLPQQKILLESDLAEQMYGDPFALIPAEALEFWRGIARFKPSVGQEIVQLCFEAPQVLYASRGVLLSCAGQNWAREDWADPGFSSYSGAQARHLVACHMAEEVGASLCKES
ncbi:Hint domain-containing protein [Thioclava sp. FR2]|uniref:Hint domain-containing protein n=1 Tax=Thioclava sp. FR2 TaxID=3445780 RepID=UPI003EBCFE81